MRLLGAIVGLWLLLAGAALAQSTTHLVVVTPFGSYTAGQTITDPATMASIQAGANASKVRLFANTTGTPPTSPLYNPVLQARINGAPAQIGLGPGLATDGTNLSVKFGTTTGTALDGGTLGIANGPAKLDGTGRLTCNEFPGLSGAVTTSAGSCATTLSGPVVVASLAGQDVTVRSLTAGAGKFIGGPSNGFVAQTSGGVQGASWRTVSSGNFVIGSLISGGGLLLAPNGA